MTVSDVNVVVIAVICGTAVGIEAFRLMAAWWLPRKWWRT